MAWIESHQELARHPKTRRLARELDESLPTALGRLQFLWWWAMDYAQDGDLSRFDIGDIADAVDWAGPAEKVVDALVVSGFLEDTEDGLIIHDWYEYAGRLIEKRAANAERMRAARAKKKSTSEDNVQRTNNARAGATVPNHTVPDQTKEPTTTTARADELDRLVDAYQKGGFGQADPMFTQQALEADLEEFGFEWTIEAMRRAVKRGKRTLAYVEAILKDWRANGGMDSGDGDKSPPKNRGQSRVDKSSAAAADQRYANFYSKAGSG